MCVYIHIYIKGLIAIINIKGHIALLDIYIYIYILILTMIKKFYWLIDWFIYLIRKIYYLIIRQTWKNIYIIKEYELNCY